MIKSSFLLLFALVSGASPILGLGYEYLRQSAITIRSNQTAVSSCSYDVIIKTSCSSVSYTTDRVSLVFGDADGNEVYAPRVDDPNTRTFERCSTYVFEIRGPCMDFICSVYLMRNGSDGWKPESITIYGPDRRSIRYYINTCLRNGLWFGINACVGVSSFPFKYALL